MSKVIFTILLSMGFVYSIAQIKNPDSLITIPMDANSWIFKKGAVEFIDYKGVRSMKLLKDPGAVEAKNIYFKNGTIEYDFMAVNHSSPSLYFHCGNDREQEIFYVRDRYDQPFANDAIQYAPIIDGVILWNLYGQYQAHALIQSGAWNHVKIIVSGWQMRVYINHASKPALQIPRLEGNEREGKIAFTDPGLISNLILKPGVVGHLPEEEAPDLTDHDVNYIRDWQLTSPAYLPEGEELDIQKLPPLSSYKDSVSAERYGLINLTRRYGKTDRNHRRVVWLKVDINATKAHLNRLQLGFCDEVWVFLNHQTVFVDKNLYLQNMRKYPDGRISILNSSFPLNLKEGKNELVIGVANNFYGWGIIARLYDLEDIKSF